MDAHSEFLILVNKKDRMEDWIRKHPDNHPAMIHIREALKIVIKQTENAREKIR
jgi:hypothetical protein